MWVEWCWPSWCSALACFVHHLVSRRADEGVAALPSYTVVLKGSTRPTRLYTRVLDRSLLCELHRFMSSGTGSLTGYFLFLLLPNGSLPFLALRRRKVFLIDGSVFWLLFDVFYRGSISWAFIFIVSFWTLRIKVLSRTGGFSAVLPLKTYILS